MIRIKLEDNTILDLSNRFGVMLYFRKYTFEELKHHFRADNCEEVEFMNGYGYVYSHRKNMICTDIYKVKRGENKDAYCVYLREKYPSEMEEEKEKEK